MLKFYINNKYKFVFILIILVNIIVNGIVHTYMMLVSGGITTSPDARMYLALSNAIRSFSSTVVDTSSKFFGTDIGATIMPGYPLMISPFFENLHLISIFQVLLLCLALYYLYKVLYNKYLIFFTFATAVWIIVSTSWSYHNQALIESSTISFLMFLMYFLDKYFKDYKLRNFAWFSVIFGVLIALNNRYIFHYCGFLPFLLILSYFERRIKFKHLAISFLIVTAIMAPWHIRQYFHYGEFVLFSPVRSKTYEKATEKRERIAKLNKVNSYRSYLLDSVNHPLKDSPQELEEARELYLEKRKSDQERYERLKAEGKLPKKKAPVIVYEPAKKKVSPLEEKSIAKGGDKKSLVAKREEMLGFTPINQKEAKSSTKIESNVKVVQYRENSKTTPKKKKSTIKKKQKKAVERKSDANRFKIELREENYDVVLAFAEENLPNPKSELEKLDIAKLNSMILASDSKIKLKYYDLLYALNNSAPAVVVVLDTSLTTPKKKIQAVDVKKSPRKTTNTDLVEEIQSDKPIEKKKEKVVEKVAEVNQSKIELRAKYYERVLAFAEKNLPNPKSELEKLDIAKLNSKILASDSKIKLKYYDLLRELNGYRTLDINFDEDLADLNKDNLPDKKLASLKKKPDIKVAKVQSDSNIKEGIADSLVGPIEKPSISVDTQYVISRKVVKEPINIENTDEKIDYRHLVFVDTLVVIKRMETPAPIKGKKQKAKLILDTIPNEQIEQILKSVPNRLAKPVINFEADGISISVQDFKIQQIKLSDFDDVVEYRKFENLRVRKMVPTYDAIINALLKSHPKFGDTPEKLQQFLTDFSYDKYRQLVYDKFEPSNKLELYWNSFIHQLTFYRTDFQLTAQWDPRIYWPSHYNHPVEIILDAIMVPLIIINIIPLLIALYRKDWFIVSLFVLVLLHLLLHTVVAATLDRYRLTIYPVWITFAVYGYDQITRFLIYAYKNRRELWGKLELRLK